MLDLYYANSGNSLRAVIALEESGLAYTPHKIDLAAGDQKAPDFLAINPSAAVPVLVDRDGPGGQPAVLSQSGLIALHVAERTGRFLPADPARRLQALRWFFAAVTDAAAANSYRRYVPRAVPGLTPETAAFLDGRLVEVLGVFDGLLEGQEHLAGELSIADFALFPVVRLARPLLESEGGFSRLLGWADRLAARPGVARAIAAL